jgi:hypothetical protein
MDPLKILTLMYLYPPAWPLIPGFVTLVLTASAIDDLQNQRRVTL